MVVVDLVPCGTAACKFLRHPIQGRPPRCSAVSYSHATTGNAGRAIDPGSGLPAAKRNQGFALYGVAVVVAPAVGPTLGGWLSDNLSWHWCFLINVPIGMICMVAIYFIIPSSPEKKRERERLWAKGVNFDLVGFLLIATFLGASKSCWTAARSTTGSARASS